MINTAKAAAFAALHIPGDPLILYNAWDVGSAKAVAAAGAKAVATGSWSVAAAQGYGDGEALPIEQALALAARIASAVDVPVTIDFEGGYAVEPAIVGANIARLAHSGAVGCNFEDQVIGDEGFHPIVVQTARIAAARAAAGADFFLNARIDLFLNAVSGTDPATLIGEAIERARAYAEAGASGVFVPGLADLDLIARICNAVPRPINVISAKDGSDVPDLASAGVARISYGPRPYFTAMAAVKTAAAAALAWR